ncbi:exonuclease V [Melampsora americana]|nr:exonuclease V [Melampsora americana]
MNVQTSVQESHTNTPESEYDELIWDDEALAIIDQIEANFISKQVQETNSNSTDQEISNSNPRLPPTHLTIEFESESSTTDLNMNPSVNPIMKSINPSLWNPSTSLYQRFRAKRGFLSGLQTFITRFTHPLDLTSSPKSRPKSIMTRAGNEIKINSDAIFTRQKVLDGGTAVHTKLEKEIIPEKIPIRTVSAVDIWGLKILNTIINLDILRDTGITRELSVWGFVGDFLVLGIIDQLELDPKPQYIKPRDPARVGRTLDDFFPSSSHTQSPPQKSVHDDQSGPSYPLVMISDNKTRPDTSLPPSLFTESTRFQLMLYKFLYDQLSTQSLDFTKLCDRLQLDENEIFSAEFIEQILPLTEGKDELPMNLRQMYDILSTELRKLSGGKKSSEILEIVYRTREASRKKPKQLELRMAPTEKDRIVLPSTQAEEEEQIARAISNSLVDLPSVSLDEGQTDEPKETESALVIDPNPLRKSLELPQTEDCRVPKSNQLEVEPKLIQTDETPPSSSSKSDLLEPRISYKRKEKGLIGSVLLGYDPRSLDRFLESALSFWNGEREPTGVPVSEIDRCRPCEFRSGCEWRQKKADEVLAKATKLSSSSQIKP